MLPLLAALSFADPMPNLSPELGEGPVIVVVSGGISLGAYEAGQLYALTEFLKKRAADHPDERHDVVFVGASAGAVNSLLASVVLWNGPAPVATPEDSLFFRAWVPLGFHQGRDSLDEPRDTAVFLHLRASTPAELLAIAPPDSDLGPLLSWAVPRLYSEGELRPNTRHWWAIERALRLDPEDRSVVGSIPRASWAALVDESVRGSLTVQDVKDALPERIEEPTRGYVAHRIFAVFGPGVGHLEGRPGRVRRLVVDELGRPDPAVEELRAVLTDDSLLSRDPIDDAIDELAGAARGHDSQWPGRVWYGGHVTRLVPGSRQDGWAAQVSEAYAFEIRREGLDLVGVPSPMRPRGSTALPFADVARLAEASSAFPVAFNPVRLDCPTYRASSFWPPGSCGGATNRLGDFVWVFDGGLYHNDPIELGWDLAEAGPGQQGATVWFVDPDRVANPHSEGGCRVVAADEPRTRREVLQALLPTVAGTFRDEPLAQFELAHDEVVVDTVCRRTTPASRYLYAFFGFYERSFRVFDFYAGMYDARTFLAKRYGSADLPPVDAASPYVPVAAALDRVLDPHSDALDTLAGRYDDTESAMQAISDAAFPGGVPELDLGKAVQIAPMSGSSHVHCWGAGRSDEACADVQAQEPWMEADLIRLTLASAYVSLVERDDVSVLGTDDHVGVDEFVGALAANGDGYYAPDLGGRRALTADQFVTAVRARNDKLIANTRELDVGSRLGAGLFRAMLRSYVAGDPRVDVMIAGGPSLGADPTAWNLRLGVSSPARWRRWRFAPGAGAWVEPGQDLRWGVDVGASTGFQLSQVALWGDTDRLRVELGIGVSATVGDPQADVRWYGPWGPNGEVRAVPYGELALSGFGPFRLAVRGWPRDREVVASLGYRVRFGR